METNQERPMSEQSKATDPERIYLDTEYRDPEQRMWCEARGETTDTEYVRADLYEGLRRKLEKAEGDIESTNDALRADAPRIAAIEADLESERHARQQAEADAAAWSQAWEELRDDVLNGDDPSEVNEVLDVIDSHCPDGDHPGYPLLRENARLRELLRDCRLDIFQTARVNQANITGVDIGCPGDPPCEERIGKYFVHQQGVDGSLELVRRIDDALATPHPGLRRTAVRRTVGAQNQCVLCHAAAHPDEPIPHEDGCPCIEALSALATSGVKSDDECQYPDCGCDGARNCMAQQPSNDAVVFNREPTTPHPAPAIGGEGEAVRESEDQLAAVADESLAKVERAEQENARLREALETLDQEVSSVAGEQCLNWRARLQEACAHARADLANTASTIGPDVKKGIDATEIIEVLKGCVESLQVCMTWAPQQTNDYINRQDRVGLAYDLIKRLDASHSAPDIGGEGEIVRRDNPDMDGTDYAHPAWWRGHDAMYAIMCGLLEKVLAEGKGSGKCDARLQAIKDRIDGLQRVVEAAKEWMANKTAVNSAKLERALSALPTSGDDGKGGE